MEKKNKETKNGLAHRILSTNWILIAILVLMGYWIFFGGNKRFDQTFSFQPRRSIVGMSDSLNADAIAKLGVDLTENLDPKLIPSLVEQAMKETVESGVSEQEFVRTLVTRVSNKIRDISTIDLNNDSIADPILVVPQNIAEGGEHLQLSIRVPDPAEVGAFPRGSDQKAWLEIAENKSIEVMTATAIKENDQNMVIQSAPNPQVYSSHPPYYHQSTSLSNVLLTSMMLSWMFSPAYYGPGFGSGYYGGAPRTTTVIRQNRAGNISNLRTARGSSAAAVNSKGQSIASNKFKNVPPKSLNQIKTTQFRSGSGQRVSRAGGFGRSSAVRGAPSSRNTFRSSLSQRRSVSSFGRRGFRRSFGGFGRRR